MVALTLCQKPEQRDGPAFVDFNLSGGVRDYSIPNIRALLKWLSVSVSHHVRPTRCEEFCIHGLRGHSRITDAAIDTLMHRLPRELQLAADRLDRLLLMKKRTADLRNRLHNQHPKRSPRFQPETYVDPSIRGVPFARRNTSTGLNELRRDTTQDVQGLNGHIADLKSRVEMLERRIAERQEGRWLR